MAEAAIPDNAIGLAGMVALLQPSSKEALDGKLEADGIQYGHLGEQHGRQDRDP